MSAMIDTHAYYRTLRGAGFSDDQADAMTNGLAAIMVGTLATKTDIAEVKTEIAEVRTEIAGVRTELKTEIAELRGRMEVMQRSFGWLATYTTLIVGIATVVNHFVK